MVGPGWRIAAVLVLLLSSEGFAQASENSGDGFTLNPSDTIADALEARVDSLVARAGHEFIFLQQQYDSVTAVASSNIQHIQGRIDSLTNSGIVDARWTAQIDSIKAQAAYRLDSLAGRMDAVRTEISGKLNGMKLPPEISSSATSRISAFEAPLEIPQIIQGPGVETTMHGIALPEIDTSLPSVDITLPSEPVVPGIPDMKLSTGDIGDLADPLAPIISGQAPIEQQVAGVVPADMESAATMIEEKAMQLPEATAVTQQLDEAAALSPMPAAPEDPEAMKEALIDDGKKMAVNHFAGKEEQLRQAMDKLAVYKKKYHSVESVANLPRKAPNPMRERSFAERLVPGLALQVGRTDHWLLDIYAYLGYRFTGRITAGAGWNQRVAYNGDTRAFSSGPVIYGPRVYGEYNIGKGFSPRLELDYMNTYVPAAFASRPDNPDGREWVLGIMAGMRKEYTITRRLKGTVMLLYNLYDPHHRSPYRNRLNGRFGLEWGISKESPKLSENRKLGHTTAK